MGTIRGFVTIAVQVAFYVASIQFALLQLLTAPSVAFVSAISGAVSAAVNYGSFVADYLYKFSVGACNVIELAVFVAIQLLCRPLYSLLRRLFDIDIAMIGATVVRVVCLFAIGAYLVSWYFAPFTWLMFQGETQQGIDELVCQTYPTLIIVIDLYNSLAEFYNQAVGPINVFLALIFDFFSDLLPDLLAIVFRGVVILLRVFISGTSTLNTCSPFNVASLAQPLCPAPNPNQSIFDTSTCVFQDAFCYLFDLYEFVAVRVIGRFLRTLFPIAVSNFVTNILIAFGDTVLMYFDIFATFGTLLTPSQPNAFLNCNPSIPLSTISSSATAQQCFMDRGRCAPIRLLCNRFYWFLILFQSPFAFFENFFVPFLDILFEPLLGIKLGTGLLEFFGVLSVALDIIKNFVQKVIDLIRMLLDPVIGRLEDLFSAFTSFSDLLRRNPLQALPKLVTALFQSSLGSAISAVQAGLALLRPIVGFLQGDVGRLFSIVNGILSGGGLFGRRHLLGFEGPDVTVMYDGRMHKAVLPPLVANESLTQQIHEATGMYDVPVDTIFSLIEVFSNNLHHECGLRQDVYDVLLDEDLKVPDLSMMGHNSTEALSVSSVQFLRYLFTRQLCGANPELVGTAAYDIMTFSPRLEDDDPCQDVLGDAVLRLVLSGNVTEEGSEWLADWYRPCALAYMANNVSLHNEKDTMLVKDDSYRMTMKRVFKQMEDAAFVSEYFDSIGHLAGIDVSDLPEHDNKHEFERPYLSFSSDERAKYRKDIYHHMTRRLPEHDDHARADRANQMLMHGSSRWHPHYGVNGSEVESDWTWMFIRVPSMDEIRSLRNGTHYENRRARMAARMEAGGGGRRVGGRRLQQGTIEREFNLSDDLIIPSAQIIGDAFIFLATLVKAAFEAVNLEIVGDGVQSVIDFALDFDISTSIDFALDAFRLFIMMLVNQFECEFDPIDNPQGEYRLACLLRLRLKPFIPTIDGSLSNWRINWGSPCSAVGVCEFTDQPPSTGFFFTDLVASLATVVTSGPCKTSYSDCREIGFSDSNYYFVYTIGYLSRLSGIDFLGFLQGEVVGLFLVSGSLLLGVQLLPISLLFDLGDLPVRLLSVTKSEDIPVVGEILFAFGTTDQLIIDDFHVFCFRWGVLTTLLSLVLFVGFFTIYAYTLFLLPQVSSTAIARLTTGFSLPTGLMNTIDQQITKDTLSRTVYVEEEEYWEF